MSTGRECLWELTGICQSIDGGFIRYIEANLQGASELNFVKCMVLETTILCRPNEGERGRSC